MLHYKICLQDIKKIVFLAVSLCGLGFLTGCAMPSKSQSMIIGKADLPQHIARKECQYTGNICLGTIEGGKETNPLWVSNVNNKEFKTALTQSLTNVDFYNSNNKGRYILRANLKELRQPFIGIDMTVTCVSNYQVYDQKLKKVVFDKTLTTPYTAKFSSALIGTERLKKANEGAVKENIKILLENLYNS